MLRSRSPVFLACAASWMAVALAPAGLAQTRLEATDIANHPFSADFAAGGQLKLRVRSAEVRILGTAENKISVELSGRSAHDESARKLKVRFERHGNAGDLRVSGGPGNGLTITVRIPSDTNLYARVPFGDVEVRNVLRDQNVELHAGELRVDVSDAASYAHVEASVFSGELDAPPFREWRGGLFRSFQTSGSGRYRLHAHVGAGQLTIESRPAGHSASASESASASAATH